MCPQMGKLRDDWRRPANKGLAGPESLSHNLPMPRYKAPEHMTAVEELRRLLKWAEQQGFSNVAAALRRVLIKLKKAQPTH
jgi:hypothetical protein